MSRWPCLSPRHVVAELALLWLILAYNLARLHETSLPWYATPSALLPWLFLRWPLVQRRPIRTPLLAGLQWLRVHTGGLALGFATLSIFFGVAPRALLPLAVGCVALLAGLTCVTVRPLRTWLAGRSLHLWAQLWPDAGRVLAPLIGIWLWDRLAFPPSLPRSVYLWIVVASSLTVWITRSSAGWWRHLFPAAVTLAPLLYTLMGSPDGEPNERLILLCGLAIGAGLAHGLVTARLGANTGELGRLWLLVVGSLWLAEPLLTMQSNGAGDAQWYALVMADAVAQWRAGFLPPYIGGSEFAFNGSSFPGCFAPYYQCFGVLLNLCTGDTLNAYALKHLTAALSLLAGALACYHVLNALAPSQRGRAAVLALLYVASPSWLGALYSMDMYMTVLTVPWLPCVFFGCIRTFVRLDRVALLWVTVPLALVWHAHPPVALWASLTVAAVQLARLLFRRRAWRHELAWSALAVAVFSTLTCLPFASAFYAQPTTDLFRHDYVLQTLVSHWHEAWLPVSSGAERLSDQHLGWSLALLAIVGGVWAVGRRQRALGALFIAATGMLLLLIPLPGLQNALWRTLPEVIKSTTNNWPTQRLYPVLAALLTVVGGAAGLRALRRAPRLPTWVFAGLGLAFLWSFAEAAKFQRRGRATTLDADSSNRRLLPENIVLTRYAYEMFSRRPDYVSDGVMNPLMKNQLIDPRTLEPLDSNSAAALRSPVIHEFTLLRSPGTTAKIELTPTVYLQPGRQYMLEFNFGPKPMLGELTIRGERVDRTYSLPATGGAAAFGSGPGQAKHLSLWTSGDNTEKVRFYYQPQEDDTAPVFARVRMIEVDLARLPVNVTSLLPYRGDVQSPKAAWLETPRMFLPGYTALVNDRLVEVRGSPQGLAMLPVPAGPSRVELRYVGPWPVRAAFWLSGAAWLALLLAGVYRLLAGFFRVPLPLAPTLVTVGTETSIAA